jgi:hypothetical protein
MLTTIQYSVVKNGTFLFEKEAVSLENGTAFEWYHFASPIITEITYKINSLSTEI